MRKTIGSNPLDAVVPDLREMGRSNKPVQRQAEGQEKEPQPALKPRKERLTLHISTPLIERAKNAVFWTPGLTLADLGERALDDLVTELESAHGGVFQLRPHELKGGRPLK